MVGRDRGKYRGRMWPRLISLLLIAACSTEPTLADSITANQQWWDDNQPASYDLEYEIWNYWETEQYWLTVRDGTVTECDAKSSQGERKACANSSVSGMTNLFRLARSYPSEHMDFTFDPTYRFPREMYYDEPGMADEETRITVTKFVELSDS